jgi:hypothetical protein
MTDTGISQSISGSGVLFRSHYPVWRASTAPSANRSPIALGRAAQAVAVLSVAVLAAPP